MPELVLTSQTEVLFEDLLECIEYGNPKRVSKLLAIPEVLELAQLTNSMGQLDVLCRAAKGGNVDVFEELIKNPDIVSKVAHYSNPYDTGLLGIAVENNHIGLVERLLAIPEVLDSGNNIAYVLGLAVKLGHIAIIDQFQKYARIAEHAYSALYFALDEDAGIEQIAGIKILLSMPKVIDQIVSNQCAKIVHGFLYPDIAKVLLEVPEISAALHANPSAALHYASTGEMLALLSIPSLQNCFAYCQERNGFDETFYNQMLSEFNTDMQISKMDDVKKLLAIKPISDYFSIRLRSDIQKVAVYAGRLDLLKCYIEGTEGEPEIDEELFSWACEGGNIHVALYMLSFSEIRGIVLANAPGQHNLINDATVGGNLKVLNVLLSLISYDATHLMREALISAAENGYADMVKRLLEFPSVYNDVSLMKTEAIVLAAKQGHYEVLMLLLTSSHDLSTLLKEDLRAILNSPNATMMIIEALLQYSSIAERSSLAIEALHAAERGNLILMNRLISLPVVSEQLKNESNLSIQLVKQSLRAFIRMEPALQSFKIDTSKINPILFSGLDRLISLYGMHAKPFLTNMQRHVLETYYQLNPSVLVFSLNEEDQQAEPPTMLIFSNSKVIDKEEMTRELPLNPVMRYKQARQKSLL